MKKFYAGIVFAGMMAAALTVTGCSNPTGEYRVYTIALDQTGAYTFPGADEGYQAQTAKTVTVTNTGNQTTGTLTIAKSGANANSFTVSPASLPSIAAGGSNSFTVVPNTGLAEGTYTTTITVSGGNDLNAGFNVNFTVNAAGNPDYSISLSEPGTYAFPAAMTGYGAQMEKNVIVSNTGNQATGALTIGKSGTNANEFTVSTNSLNSIAVDANNSFTVVPNTGLTEGTYTAVITVSGGNSISASFNVSFTVSDSPAYGIGLSQTGPYTFPGVSPGYPTQSARIITVNNTGNQATGSLTIGKSGANSGSFTVAPANLPSIAIGGNNSFTVVPNTGLAEGIYTATITVSGGNSISAGFNVSFTVSTAPVYSIELSQTEPYIFPEAAPGYPTQSARTVTVDNTGNQATGTLTVGKSGANAGSFTVAPASLSSIAAGGNNSFTVVPVTGLAEGTYTAVITVSGGNSISANFNVSFTVSAAPAYSIELSQTGPYSFPDAAPGYGAQSARTVTVYNTGNQATGALTVRVSGVNAGSFTVSPASLPSIAAGGNNSFTVVPNTGLAEGTYTAVITVSGGNDISAGFNVSFTVNPATPVYSVDLSETGTYIFPPATESYGAQTAQTVTVTNTGNQATGTLTIGKSGANATNFTVSPASLNSIAIEGTATFTVVPNTALGAGAYTAIITVSGENGISASFGVSFTVNPATPVYSVDLSETGTYIFPPATEGYGAQAAQTVTVTNTGNQATGALTIGKSGTNAGSFTVSKTGISDIAIDDDDTFTVVPVTALGVGTYTATITVSGSDGISASFGVSFTVNPSPIYGIGLSETGTHVFQPVAEGYGAQTEKTITVTNTGNQATGALTVGKSGANTASFTVSPGSLGSIATEGTAAFTVVPNTALGAGTYTATITVSGGNGISASFDVSFTVNPYVLYTVTFNSSGGTPAISTAQTSYGDNTVSLPSNPVRTGYTFSGWYTAQNGGGTAFTAATAVTADITVYAKWLSSNANLASLSVDTGWLDQTFSPSTTSYTMTVPNTTASVTVSATEMDSGKASVAFPDGNSVSLNPGANTIRVRVTAEDGTTTRTYTITVTRTPLSGNANLGSLVVSEGTLNPAFSANITGYTVLVSNGTSFITVTAAVADTGKATLAQSPLNPVSLSSASTDITLTVTAEDGSSKDYTVTVNKTTENNAVSIAISVADERIDLTRNTENDLSREAYDTLRLTAPEGYAGYTWRVDGNSNYITLSERVIEINPNGYWFSYGTHSVLLEYTKDGITHGCEVVFKVVR